MQRDKPESSFYRSFLMVFAALGILPCALFWIIALARLEGPVAGFINFGLAFYFLVASYLESVLYRMGIFSETHFNLNLFSFPVDLVGWLFTLALYAVVSAFLVVLFREERRIRGG